jgi:hypothetical protein
MKKTLVALCLSLGLAPATQAGPVGFGFKAGAGLATQVTSYTGPSFQSDLLPGFNAGFFACMDFADFVQFQPEFQFIQKGIGFHADHVAVISGPSIVGYANANDAYTFDYLEVPAVFKFHTTLAPQLEGNLQIGPTLAVLLNAYDHYEISSYGSGDRDITSSYNTLDVGFLVGAGIQTGPWSLDARYERGLTSIYKNSGGISTVNSVLTLQAGYQLF